RIPKLYNSYLTSLDLNIYHNYKMIRIDAILPSPSLTNWTWEQADYVENGKIRLTGSGNLPTGFDLELFTIDFTVFLGDVKESTFDIEMRNNGCTAPLDIISKVILSNVCFVDGRLVTFAETPYFLNHPEPNPVVDNINLKFGVAFDENVQIVLLNVFGEIVRVVVNDYLKAGIYQMQVDASDLSNGFYLLKMISGSFQQLIPVVVTK
ncbi:MAG: T9SS type A sorting domain-containing protein, partial [Candidatus Kapaibacteriota bacterium]